MKFVDLMSGLLGREVLIRERGTLVAPGYKRQRYTPFTIDLSHYENGVLVIQVQLESGESAGSFDLYPAGTQLPTVGDPIGSVAHAWDVRPGTPVTLQYPFSGTPDSPSAPRATGSAAPAPRAPSRWSPTSRRHAQSPVGTRHLRTTRAPMHLNL